MSTKMPNKMLIDATHPEETRVVVVRGNRVEEFDFETAQRKQLRGNIYLAKVTRVEPSLQAAFIEYGGNRHGFLAFSEIHPDYYQIPVADRQALIEADERAHREAEEESENRSNRRRPRHRNSRRRGHGDRVRSEIVEGASADPSQAPQPYGDHEAAHEAEYHADAEAQDHEPQDHEPQDHEAQGHEAHDHEAREHDAHDSRPDAQHDLDEGSHDQAETPVTAAVEESVAAAIDEPAAPEFKMKDLARQSNFMTRRHTQSRRAKTPRTRTTRSMPNMRARSTPSRLKPSGLLRRSATSLTMMTMKARTPRKKSSNPLAATTCWKRCPSARSAHAASTRFRRSSSAVK